jgi:hypothetical protein
VSARIDPECCNPLLSDGAGRIGGVELGESPHVFQGFIVYSVTNENQSNSSAKGKTHAESGASLSLFSSKYLTSEISRQPALLNSTRND